MANYTYGKKSDVGKTFKHCGQLYLVVSVVERAVTEGNRKFYKLKIERIESKLND